MKKIFFILILSLSVITFAQTAQLNGKTNIQSEPSSSVSAYQVETKKYSLNITIENSSIVKGLVLKPNENYLSMYLNGNWGTIDKKVSFNEDVNLQTVPFIFARRVVKMGDFYKLYQEGVPCDEFVAFMESKIFEDVKTIKLSCTAEFIGSDGKKIKKDLEINFDKNSKEAGDEVFATASITNEDLGLNVVTLKVAPEKLFFKFSLRNDEYGVNMVVTPTKKSKKVNQISVLAGQQMPDGIHTFICRVGLPNGIQKEESIEAFVEDGEISLDNSSFNPLVFANGDYGTASFKGKVTLVKFVNTRSTALVLFLPTDYVVSSTKSFTNVDSDIQTETFIEDGGGWKSYVIAPGGYVKVKCLVSAFPYLIQDLNRNKNDMGMLGLESKPFQVVSLKWGKSFSLSRY